LRNGRRVSGVVDHLSVGSSYGSAPRPYRELIGHQFSLANPLANLIARKARPLNIPYMVANFIWTTSGSDLLEDIAFWNGRAYSFSDDATCIRSALGPRLFSDQQQFYIAQEKIRNDPNTRRSIVVFVEPRDLLAPTRDVPCMATLQFMLRDYKLHAVATMRSQSALMVMPYDIALLAGLQCLMAMRLGVAVGTYTHFSASFHCYDDELDIARSVAAGNLSPLNAPMPCDLPDLQNLAQLMRRLQSAPLSELRRISAEPTKEHHPYQETATRILVGAALEKLGDYQTAQDLWSGAGSLGQLCELSHTFAAHRTLESSNSHLADPNIKF